MGLLSGLSLNLHIFICLGVAMALAILHIFTGSTEPSLCDTAISTKIKCAGLFALLYTLNQAKLDTLKIQIDDNYWDIYA